MLLWTALGWVVGQELNCRVQVMHRQIQGTNVQVFEAMQNSLTEMINQTHWTTNVYTFDERIECSIVLNISEYSGDEFKGYVQVQSQRPVFGSSYNTVMLNFKERGGELHFRYNEGEQLIYSPNGSNGALVSTVAFYANIIVGLDYDSFGNEAGTPFFQKAQKIVSDMQSTPFSGWKSYESLRNRYWLAEDFMNPTYGPLRRCSYRYHRLGFDLLSSRMDQGRAEIAESLKLIQKVNRNKPNSFLVQLWLIAKGEEIVNLFAEAQTTEKNQVYSILLELDPANQEKYSSLKQ
ncbi:MAG: hypothetical protein RIS47_1939 [Bacteroidota bacterium]|jgi:hypothetical protein